MNDAWKNEFYREFEKKKDAHQLQKNGPAVQKDVSPVPVVSNETTAPQPKLIMENYQLETTKDEYIRSLELENMRLKSYVNQLKCQSYSMEGFTGAPQGPFNAFPMKPQQTVSESKEQSFDDILKYILIGVFIIYVLETLVRRN